MGRQSRTSLLIAGLLLLSTPAFATIVYTNGQDRTTPITSSETLLVNNAESATQSGVISGTNTVITRNPSDSFNRSGILNLTNTNTYGGGTLLNAGTTRAGNDFAFGTGSITINDGATLDSSMDITLTNNIVLLRGQPWIYANGHNIALNGTVSGLESLRLLDYSSNGGSITLAGNNTYWFNTYLIHVTLKINSVNNLGLAQGNTFSGDLNMDDSTLQTLAPMNFNKTIFLSNHGPTIIDTNGYDSTFSGVIFDRRRPLGGTLTKNGAGTLTLTANNTYEGGTVINGGTLQVGDSTHTTASIIGDVNVVGGTLSGYGSIGTIPTALGIVGGNVTNGANVGASQLATLAISGNYIQKPSGNLIVQLTPSGASVLAIAGTASLNGQMIINFNPGTYTARTYTILTATNITGTFVGTSGVNTPDGFALNSINYSPTAITIDFAGTGTLDAPLIPAPSGVSELGSTTSSTVTSSNQASSTIFDHLDNSGSAGDTGGDTGANSERDALTFASLTNKSLSNSENTQAGLSGLAKALPEVARKNGGWFKGTGNLASVESSGAKAGFASETGGFLFGFDREVDKGVRIGAAGGYDHTSLSTFNGINANAETNSMRFAIYGSKAFKNDIALDAQMGYALHMMDGDRFESNTGTTATNSHIANEYSTGFQVSKKFDVNGFTFKPKAGINYAHVDEDGYTETGAGLFNATIASKSINSLRLSTGFGISHHMKPRDGFAFTPEVHIKYSYEALDSTTATSGSQRGIGFVSTGVEPSHHIVTTGIGFSTNLDDDLSAFGNYDVNLPTGNSFEQTFTLGLRLNF